MKVYPVDSQEYGNNRLTTLFNPTKGINASWVRIGTVNN